jgi:arylsulfatase A-like enzyme/Flp pilus assembly protein TadD
MVVEPGASGKRPSRATIPVGEEPQLTGIDATPRSPRARVLVLALLACAACSGPSERRPEANVLLITLDTTRADHISAYGDSPAATPNLDALAAEGVLFERAVSSVPLTGPAHASLFTGRTPLGHGIRDNIGFYLDDAQLTLAELLGAEGFRTFAVAGAFVLQRGWGIGQGFADYDDAFELGEGDEFSPMALERRASEVVRRAISWWEAHPEERFFGWLHFYDPHLPYSAPPPYGERHAEAPYVGEIEYVDAQLGVLFDFLRDSGRLDETLVVVVGDHGEGLGEHGEGDHGIFLYDSTLSVPLIVRAPGGAPRGRVPHTVRDIDILPTVLDYVGVTPPPVVEGRSLLEAMAGRDDEPRPAYAETWHARLHYGWSELQSLREGPLKYVRAPQSELYDLDDDPGEQLNLAWARQGQLQTLETGLGAWIERIGDSEAGSSPEAIDPEALEHLRSLGYVGSTVRVEGDLPDPKDRIANLSLLSRVSREAAEAMRAGRHDHALRLFEQAIAVEPNFLDAHQQRGNALLRMGRAADAVAALERALELNPDNVATLHELAKAHLAAGDARTGLALLQRVHSISPEVPTAYFTRADALVELGRPQEAVAELERLLQVDPASPRARYELGRLRLRLGDLPGARGEILRALEIELHLFSAHFNLGLIAEALGDGATARREYEAELDSFPDNHEAWANLGLLQAAAGDGGRAAEAFRNVIELRPDLYQGYYLRARLQLATGRVDADTLELARKAVELSPDSAQARELERAIRANR